MTKRQALEILIKHAARNIAGTGVGIRPALTIKDKEEVSAAITKVWKDVYNYPCGKSELWNLGIH